MTSPLTPTLWPNPAQEALLRAALGSRDVALSAFDEWLAQVDLERDIDGASYRLLPLLHFNLTALGSTHPVVRKLAGVYRRSWCESQTRYRRLDRPLALLSNEAIPVMLSKGIVLACHHYPSPGMRPMSDVDLVVPQEAALRALDLLEQDGWKMAADALTHWGRRRQEMLALISGVNLYHEAEGELDLQWRLVHECLSGAADRRFWTGAVPITIGERRVLRPSPTDLLFHVIIHGTRPNQLSPIRWIADAVMILRREGTLIDWNALTTFAREMRLSRRLGIGLAYLSEAMKVDLPASALAACQGKPGWVERLEARADRELLSGSGREGGSLTFLAFLLRFIRSDGRRLLPRLALNWLARKITWFRRSHVSA